MAVARNEIRALQFGCVNRRRQSFDFLMRNEVGFNSILIRGSNLILISLHSLLSECDEQAARAMQSRIVSGLFREPLEQIERVADGVAHRL